MACHLWPSRTALPGMHAPSRRSHPYRVEPSGLNIKVCLLHTQSRIVKEAKVTKGLPAAGTRNTVPLLLAALVGDSVQDRVIECYAARRPLAITAAKRSEHRNGTTVYRNAEDRALASDAPKPRHAV